MEVIKVDDPVTLAKYAQDKKIEHQTAWKWTHRAISTTSKDIPKTL